MKKTPNCNKCGGEHYTTFCRHYPKIPSSSEKPNNSKVKQKPSKPKKLSRAKLKNTLDKLVKNYVKLRDNHTCQWCGKVVSGKSCQGSHVFSVGSCSLLQFESLNIKVLCAYCHRRRWHSSPPEAMAWFGKKFPERLAKLEELKLTAKKISTYELQVLIDGYKAKLKSIS